MAPQALPDPWRAATIGWGAALREKPISAKRGALRQVFFMNTCASCPRPTSIRQTRRIAATTPLRSRSLPCSAAARVRSSDRPRGRVAPVVHSATHPGPFERGIVTEAQPVPRSTVHRLFSRSGLVRKTAEPSEQDRRRFSFAQAGELWMSDVMHGPTVDTGERGQRTMPI